ncbi:MAG: hypothetical protein HY906_01105 [Deltaproteobacteria bacterium]|nr:hypothetical protein [Deltaproteobacteria bacterium]
MSRVLLIRPNDFIADAMVSLLVRLDLEAVRVVSPDELRRVALLDVVGAVASTAATSAMSLSFRDGVAALRSRSMAIPLVVTTMMQDASRAASFVLSDLAGLTPPGEPILLGPQALAHPALGSPRGLLLLRKSDVEEAAEATVQCLRRHFGRGG